MRKFCLFFLLLFLILSPSIIIKNNLQAEELKKVRIYFCSYYNGKIEARLYPCGKHAVKDHTYSEWLGQRPKNIIIKMCYSPKANQIVYHSNCNDIDTRIGVRSEFISSFGELINPTSARPTIFDISQNNYVASNKSEIKKTKKNVKNEFINKQEKKSDIYKKNISLFDLSYDPEINIELLGNYESFILPKYMQATFGKGCKSEKCIGQESAKKMSLGFKRGEKYNKRHPGNIFFSMAYYELFFQMKIKDNERILNRLKKNYPNHSYSDGLSTFNLIKLNRIRSKLRNALGMTLLTPTEEAVNNFWKMGEYVERNNSENTEKKEFSVELQKRIELLNKFREVAKDIQKKIEEENLKTLKANLAKKENFFKIGL